MIVQSASIDRVDLKIRRRGPSWAKTLLGHSGFEVGAAIFAAMILLGLLAPLIAPRSPFEISMNDRFMSPGREFWLGSDHLGRDLWSRLLFGARLSMFVGTVVTGISLIGGVVLGLIGGYSRRIGNVVMRFVDGFLAFPGIILALSLIAVLGSRLSNVMIALSIVFTPRIARVMHGVVLELKDREYVLAAVAIGSTSSRILIRHILPNSVGPIFVQGSFNFANAIIAEASLSFLGVGVPLGTPSWGSILSEGRNYMLRAPWITVPPGIAIFMAVMGLNLLGDSLRDILDPRLRGSAGGAER
jgi:peptide/nickel transport system permease protein